jgi:lipoprotein-anchoring transpeptidase ErfK/SrfK
MMTGWIALVMLAVAQAAAPQKAPAAAPAGTQQVDPLQAQVMLDRAGFSPGAIDGRMGANTKKALAAFHAAGKQSQPVEATTRYTITAQDAAGPFQEIPSDIMQQASLPSLGYTSIVEALAERFHTVPALLQQLNPGTEFVEGDAIVVPNVEAMVIPAVAPTIPAKKPAEQVAAETAEKKAAAAAKPDVTVTVSKAESALRVTDASGAVIFYAPVTTGSEHDPLPIGEWKVTGVQFNPTFHYNPELFWDADPKNTKATIPAGPNNPVGLVWVDLTKEHYGMHGTPEPATIGRTESHGCVRLTNWDALKLAGLVKPGTRVTFAE